MFYCQNRLSCNYNCLHPTTPITLLHIFFKDSSHRCRTAILLNTSEWLLTKILKKKNTQTHLKNGSQGFRFLVKLQIRMLATLLKMNSVTRGSK